jgi:hypothetical protein
MIKHCKIIYGGEKLFIVKGADIQYTKFAAYTKTLCVIIKMKFKRITRHVWQTYMEKVLPKTKGVFNGKNGERK